MTEVGEKGDCAGIGSRKITATLSRIIMELSCCLVFKGLRIRSGGADGSDTSFETGAQIAYDALRQRYNLAPEGIQKALSVFLP